MANLPTGAYRSGSLNCDIVYDENDLPIGFSNRGNEIYPVAANVNPLTGMVIVNPATGLPMTATGCIDVRGMGAKCDGQAVYNAAVTGASAGSMTITSATANFTSADVGKLCAHLPKTATGNYTRFGSITAINSATSATVALSGITTGTLQQFVWGTDDSAAIDLSLSAAVATRSPVFFPSAITCSSKQHIVPTGITCIGVANATGVGYARDFEYYNSSVVLLNYAPEAGGFFKLGNNGVGNTGSNSGTRGTNLRSLNIDALNLSTNVVGSDTGTNSSRGNHIVGCTLIRASGPVLLTSPSSVTTLCTIVQQQQSYCVTVSGDSRFISNYVYGSAATFSVIKVNGSDVEVSDNHIWKDADTASATGPCLLLDIYGGVTSSPSKGALVIQGNQFDTSFGPHIQISVAASTYGRAISIVGNVGFQNDNVPNATYPCIDIDVAAGGSLRALTVTGNTFQGSWNDNTKGQYTALIDGVGIVGTVIASSVVANVADNCASLYASFTPTYTAGNHTIAGAVATVVVTG